MISFELPDELIAQEPARPRDSARLLVYNRADKSLVDAVFSDLPKFLVPDTVLAVNNSKVEHCRWLFSGGRIEIFVLEKLDTHNVRALVRPGRKFKLGSKLRLADWLETEVTAVDDEGIRSLRLTAPHDDQRLKAYEHVPLPPYIAQNDRLAGEYQTVYAEPLGSKAAPTAGLHFTDRLLKELAKKHAIAEVTLHVGLGTFAALTDENFKTGRLHTEIYDIQPKTADMLKKADHVTAVGTTSARTLETWAENGRASGGTDIFIQPGHEFKRLDSLVTNFHLPGTSLLLMVEAFVGSADELQRIYDHAIGKKYRFYSFGDAMIIL